MASASKDLLLGQKLRDIAVQEIPDVVSVVVTVLVILIVVGAAAMFVPAAQRHPFGGGVESSPYQSLPL